MQPGRRSILKGGLASLLGLFGLGTAAHAKPVARITGYDPSTKRATVATLEIPANQRFTRLRVLFEPDMVALHSDLVMPMVVGDIVELRNQRYRVSGCTIESQGGKAYHQTYLLLIESQKLWQWAYASVRPDPIYWKVDETNKWVYRASWSIREVMLTPPLLQEGPGLAMGDLARLATVDFQ